MPVEQGTPGTPGFEPEPDPLAVAEHAYRADAMPGLDYLSGATRSPYSKFGRVSKKLEMFDELQKNEYLAGLMNQRMSTFDEYVVRRMPLMATKMAFSSMPQEQFIKTARALNKIVPWLEQRDSMAGQPGLLTQARAFAVWNNNKAGLEFLDQVQALPVDQQNILLSFLRSAESRVQGVTLGLEVDDPEVAERTEAIEILKDMTGATIKYDEAGNLVYVLPNSNQSIDILTAFRTLFPEGVGSGSAIAGSSWMDQWLDNPGGTTAAVAGRALRIGLSYAAVPFEIPKAVAEYMSEVNNLNPKDTAFSVRMAGVPGDVFNAPFVLIDHAARPLGESIADSLGFAPDDPRYEDIVGGFSALATLFVLGKGGKFIRAFKTGREMLPDVSRAELGIELPVGEKAFGGGFTGRLPADHPLQSGFVHPNKLLNDLITRAGHDLASKPLAEAVHTNGIVTDLFDRIQVMKDTYHGSHAEIVGAVRRMYGSKLPADLVESLVRTSRAEMPAKFVDWVEGVRTAGADATAAQARVLQAEQRLSQITPEGNPEGLAARSATAQEAFNKLTDQTTHGGYLDRISDYQRKYEHQYGTRPSREQAARYLFDEATYLDYKNTLRIAEGLVANEVRYAREASALRVEIDAARAAQSRALQASQREPLFQYPRVSRLRAAILEPASRAERFIYKAFTKPLRKLGADPNFWRDELPRFPELMDPNNPPQEILVRAAGNKNAARNYALQHNADVLTNYLRRLNVPDRATNRLIGEMGELRTQQDFYQWGTRMSREIDSSLPANTPIELRTSLTRWWDTAREARTQSVIDHEVLRGDGTRYMDSEPVVSYIDPRDASGRVTPLPASPTDFLGRMHLPDVDLAIAATSMVRRGIRAAAKKNWAAGRMAEAAYFIPKFVMRAGTVIFKAPILALRIPAMATRIQIEQALRARMFGSYRPITLFPGGVPMMPEMIAQFAETFGGSRMMHIPADSRYVRFGEAKDMDLGSIYEQLSGTPVTESWVMDHTADYMLGKRTPQAYVWKGWTDSLSKLNADWFDRTFAADGLNVGRMLERIERDTRFKDYAYQQQLPLLRQAWGDLPVAELFTRWLGRKGDHIRTITRNDPSLLDAVATGRWRERGTAQSYTSPTTGNSLRAEYETAQGRLNAARARAQELRREWNANTLSEADTAALRVLQDEIRAAKNRLRELERQGVAPTFDGVTRLSDTNAFASALRDRWQKGEISMPNVIPVKRRYSVDEMHGWRETLQSIGRHWDDAWYKPYRALTWADIRGTRGSVYYQASERAYNGLKARGYSEFDAVAYAQMHGAKITRDLMYDLSARTSFHRAVRDVFWFAPATMEIAATWFGKIPSTMYPGVGHYIMAGQARALFQLLQSTGLIQKDANGEDVIMLPGLTDAVEAMTLGKLKLPDTAFFKAKGFNLVLSQPWPALSTFPAAILGKAQRKYGGVFKWLGDLMLPFSPDVTAIPQQVTYGWSALTGNPFPGEFLSPDVAKQRYDRAYDIALQYAYDELQQEGTLPPRPEQFADQESEETGRPTLSDEAEAEFREASKSYTKTLFSLAERYFRGTALVSLLGSSVTPSSLYTTDTEREAMRQFFNDIVGPAGFGQDVLSGVESLVTGEKPRGGFNEEQRALIDDYLMDHPNSTAYAVFYTSPGEKQRDLPYQSTGDDAIFDAYYTGERLVDNPELFARKLQSTESYRFYAAQLNRALIDIAGEDLDAPSLLLNGHERMQAVIQYRENWDRYVSMTPHVEDDLRTTRLAMAEQYGIPVRTYEADRLSQTLLNLQAMSAFFTGESGMRLPEFKAVVGELKGLYSSTGEFGEPRTKTERQMNWYYDNVLAPYLEETEQFYIQAREATESGEDASIYYDALRTINARYAARSLKHNGETFPTPEQVFFGNKTPVEQEEAVINWTTKPLTWLTPFQMEKAGYANFDGRDEMLSKLAKFDDEYHQFLIDEAVAPNSKYADQLERWAYEQKYGIAQEYGTQGVEMFQLNEATPLQRLEHTNFGGGNATWSNVVGAVEFITGRLTTHELSVRGYSAEALYYKTWLYRTVTEKMQTDPAFAELMENLSYAIPERGLMQRSGVPLFEAIFFGQYNTSLIPESLIQSVGA